MPAPPGCSPRGARGGPPGRFSRCPVRAEERGGRRCLVPERVSRREQKRLGGPESCRRIPSAGPGGWTSSSSRDPCRRRCRWRVRKVNTAWGWVRALILVRSKQGNKSPRSLTTGCLFGLFCTTGRHRAAPVTGSGCSSFLTGDCVRKRCDLPSKNFILLFVMCTFQLMMQ